MWWLNARRREDLVEEILTRVMMENYLNQHMRDTGTLQDRLGQMRLAIQDALSIALSRQKWWRRRRNKKCEPVPCPPFTEEHLNVS